MLATLERWLSRSALRLGDSHVSCSRCSSEARLAWSNLPLSRLAWSGNAVESLHETRQSWIHWSTILLALWRELALRTLRRELALRTLRRSLLTLTALSTLALRTKRHLRRNNSTGSGRKEDLWVMAGALSNDLTIGSHNAMRLIDDSENIDEGWSGSRIVMDHPLNESDELRRIVEFSHEGKFPGDVLSVQTA